MFLAERALENEVICLVIAMLLALLQWMQYSSIVYMYVIVLCV